MKRWLVKLHVGLDLSHSLHIDVYSPMNCVFVIVSVLLK